MNSSIGLLGNSFDITCDQRLADGEAVRGAKEIERAPLVAADEVFARLRAIFE